jgi:hypothetical protein
MLRKITIVGVVSAVLVAVLSTLGSVAGAASGNLFAVVAMNGTLLSGGGVSGVTYLGPGRYEVTFTSNVSQCAYVATTENAYSQSIQVFTAGGHLSANGVYVETKNQGGGLLDGPFDLVVDCGATGTQYAVVGYTANLVRSSPGTTLSNPGPGRYKVKFTTNIKNCAYLATVGDPANGIALAPNNVSTGSWNSKTVYVETKNPGGGLDPGIPFHLAVICPNANASKALVVGADGLASRGSSLTSSFNASTGNYVIATSAAVRPGCAAVATRGSIDTAVPFNPATVEITPGPAPNTVGIQVRELLFFGNALTNEAFHAAIVC